MRSQGMDARVLTFHRRGRPRAPYVTFLEAAGIPVTVIPEHLRFDPGTVWRARRAIRAFAPDVIQTHSYKATVLARLLRAWGGRFKWVGCFHGATAENTLVRLYHRIDLWSLRQADAIVLMSETQRAALGSDSPRARVIHNAVLPPPRHGLATSPLWAPATFAYVGRLSPEKGCDLLLAAAGVLAAEQPDRPWRLIIAGDGPSRPALEAQAADLGLGARVSFIGQVPEPWDVYRAAECIVLPSRSEGLPNVLLEAIAADRTIIATTVGAIPGLIGPSAAAMLVPPQEIGALAEAMRHVLQAPRHPEASHDRGRIAAEYTVASRLEAHLEVYSSLLDGPRRPLPDQREALVGVGR